MHSVGSTGSQSNSITLPYSSTLGQSLASVHVVPETTGKLNPRVTQCEAVRTTRPPTYVPLQRSSPPSSTFENSSTTGAQAHSGTVVPLMMAAGSSAGRRPAPPPPRGSAWASSGISHTTPATSATPRHATPRHATPRHATPRHATPRHATPRHARAYSSILEFHGVTVRSRALIVKAHGVVDARSVRRPNGHLVMFSSTLWHVEDERYVGEDLDAASR